MTTSIAPARESRVAISLRLPPVLVDTVERYAVEHRLSKTDAFLHFLSKGIAAEHESDAATALERIEEKVSETLRLVRRQHGVAADKRFVIDAVVDACKEFPSVRRAYLFGSFARGTFDDGSDIDIRLEIDSSSRFTLRDLTYFSKRIEEETGRSIDVVTASNIKNESLRKAIERDKELIYDREVE